jgi:hypothetical protein
MAKIPAKMAAAIAIMEPNFELTESARDATGGTEFAVLPAEEVAAADPVFEADVDLDVDLVPLEVAVVDPEAEVLAPDTVLAAEALVEEKLELMVN